MLPYHLGLGAYSAEVMYLAGIAAILLSLFWRPIIGLYYLVPILPLQTIRYRMIDLPLGSSMVTLVMIAVVLGLLRKREFISTPWSRLLFAYCGFLFVSHCFGSFFLGQSSPLSFADSRLADFKDYLLMPLLVLCIAGAVHTSREIRITVILMCLGMLAVDKGVWGAFGDRDYSAYDDSMRESGVMGQAGANGLGAFTAQAAIFAVAFASMEKQRILKLLYWGLAAFSALCLMYSFSRGGWIAFLAGWVFIGVRKKPLLLAVMLVFGLLWASVVPDAVRDRIGATKGGELDHSSETRVTLWEDALSVVGANIVFGTGFNTYAFMGRVGSYRDTHNLYIKVLVETGIVGLIFLLWFLARTARTGLRLMRETDNPLFGALGLALAAWVVCSFVANLFGDRWNYLQVNSYLWIMCGLVSRAFVIEQESDSAEELSEETESGGMVPVGYEAADAV